MTPELFKEIRLSLKLSAQGMAEFIGLKSGRMIRYYESGKNPIPQWVKKLLEAKGAFGNI